MGGVGTEGGTWSAGTKRDHKKEIAGNRRAIKKTKFHQQTSGSAHQEKKRAGGQQEVRAYQTGRLGQKNNHNKLNHKRTEG